MGVFADGFPYVTVVHTRLRAYVPQQAAKCAQLLITRH